MNQNDLIIDIGANLAPFNAAMKDAIATTKKTQTAITSLMTKNKRGNNSFMMSTAELAKQLDANKAEYDKFADEIKKINKNLSDSSIKEAYDANKKILADNKERMNAEKALRKKLIKDIKVMNSSYRATGVDTAQIQKDWPLWHPRPHGDRTADARHRQSHQDSRPPHVGRQGIRRHPHARHHHLVPRQRERHRRNQRSSRLHR